MSVRIVKGIDLIEDVRKYDAVLVGSDIKNTRGNGFHRKVMVNFPYVEDADKSTQYSDPRKLGKAMFIEGREGNPAFVLCYITKGRMRPDICPDSLDYEALESCLELVRDELPGKRIASTVMGESPFEGGGDRKRVLEIFEKVLCRSDISLYDYEQEDYKQENAREWHEITGKIGSISKDEYYGLKKKFLWKETFGIYSEMPDLPEREIKKIIRNYKNNR